MRADIAEACFDADKFRQAWDVMRKKLDRAAAVPEQWRSVYKCLLLTEHLLKNSSQHVVQTILDAGGIIAGLQQFKHLDERGKDVGINASVPTTKPARSSHSDHNSCSPHLHRSPTAQRSFLCCLVTLSASALSASRPRRFATSGRARPEKTCRQPVAQWACRPPSSP